MDQTSSISRRDSNPQVQPFHAQSVASGHVESVPPVAEETSLSAGVSFDLPVAIHLDLQTLSLSTAEAASSLAAQPLAQHVRRNTDTAELSRLEQLASDALQHVTDTLRARDVASLAQASNHLHDELAPQLPGLASRNLAEPLVDHISAGLRTLIAATPAQPALQDSALQHQQAAARLQAFDHRGALAAAGDLLSAIPPDSPDRVTFMTGAMLVQAQAHLLADQPALAAEVMSTLTATINAAPPEVARGAISHALALVKTRAMVALANGGTHAQASEFLDSALREIHPVHMARITLMPGHDVASRQARRDAELRVQSAQATCEAEFHAFANDGLMAISKLHIAYCAGLDLKDSGDIAKVLQSPFAARLANDNPGWRTLQACLL
jgi:hypothetical protein